MLLVLLDARPAVFLGEFAQPSPRYPNEVARWVADELIIPTLSHLD